MDGALEYNGSSPCFDSLYLRSVAVWCVPSPFLHQWDRIQGNKEKISSIISYSWSIACMSIHCFEVLFYESWTPGSIWSPQRFFQSFQAFGLLSVVHFCMDISPVTARIACLGAKVDFCLLSLLLCLPLFYQLTDSNHSFNPYFNRSFRTKNYEKQFSIVVKTDPRAILCLGLDFVSDSD